MSDPLEALLAWPINVREDVIDALSPYLGIDQFTGKLVFHSGIDNGELLGKLHKLGNAASVELGISDRQNLSLLANEANELADNIAEYADE
ncbi:hypothetical protein LCGC14_1189430 [marine sediment metagenome]|uniref:Uncharacterized protein n=1 Tax=marine sediment metagenome TaxID=412755 RepID=A0A0F9P2M6_9ZZZZ